MPKVFLDDRPVTHYVLGGDADVVAGDPAVCGRSPFPERWRGIWVRAEVDKARELPLCVSCRAVLMKRGGL